MAHFAVIETGGKQYKVAAGDKLKIEKLKDEVGSNVSFSNVLLVVNGEAVEVGVPHLKGKDVEGKVVSVGRAEKKVIFKYHSKTRLRKRKGHRQQFTEVEITKIPA